MKKYLEYIEEAGYVEGTKCVVFKEDAEGEWCKAEDVDKEIARIKNEYEAIIEMYRSMVRLNYN